MNEEMKSKVGEKVLAKMLANGYLEFDGARDLLVTEKGMLRIDELIQDKISNTLHNIVLDKITYFKMLDEERNLVLKESKHPVEALIRLEGEKMAFDKYYKFNKESLH